MVRSLVIGAGSVVVGLLGGNLIGVMLFAFWAPGWTPSYSNPGGIILALLQGALSVSLTYYLCRNFADLELARKALLFASGVACAIFAITNLLILGATDKSMFWETAASIAAFAPWIVATLKPQLIEDLTA
jgi:hypothetical protein